MHKHHIIDLDSLSKMEKIKIAQMLWEDIAADQSYEGLNDEHKHVLDQRLVSLNNGTSTFKSWADIEEKYKPNNEL